MIIKKAPLLYIGFSVLFLAIIILFSTTRTTEAPALTESDGALETIPEMALYDIENVLHELTSFIGTKVLIVSWATWSPFSEGALSQASELHNSLTNVTIVTINRAESRGRIKQYVERSSFSGPLHLTDPQDHFFKTVAGYDVPEFLIYNEKGELTHHLRGPQEKDLLLTLLE
ncbi:MAG: hypothetical protein WDZ88_03630 [Candidatus Paceibacterota bacterium]